MVVVAILGLLAALAGPSFSPLIERWRVRQTTESLQSTLYVARSEAIKRGGGISIKAKSNRDWGSGWEVLFNNNGTNEVVQNTDAPIRVTISEDSNNSTLTLDRWGQFNNTQLVFRLFPQGTNASDTSASALCIGIGGRIKRLTKGNDVCS